MPINEKSVDKYSKSVKLFIGFILRMKENQMYLELLNGVNIPSIMNEENLEDIMLSIFKLKRQDRSNHVISLFLGCFSKYENFLNLQKLRHIVVHLIYFIRLVILKRIIQDKSMQEELLKLIERELV